MMERENNKLVLICKNPKTYIQVPSNLGELEIKEIRDRYIDENGDLLYNVFGN